MKGTAKRCDCNMLRISRNQQRVFLRTVLKNILAIRCDDGLKSEIPWALGLIFFALSSSAQEVTPTNLYYQYTTAPLKFSEETNRLLVADIGSDEWLDPIVNPVDKRSIDQKYADNVSDIADQWAELNKIHSWQHKSRVLTIRAARITAGADIEPISAGLLTAVAEAAFWEDKALSKYEIQVEVNLIKSGLDELDRRHGASPRTADGLLKRADQLLAANGPFRGVKGTVKDALQDRILKYTAETVKELETAVSYNAAEIGLMADKYGKLKADLDEIRGIQAGQKGQSDRVKSQLDGRLDEAKAASNSQIDSEKVTVQAQKDAQKEALKYAKSFQAAAVLANQVGDLATALKLPANTVKSIRKGQAVLGVVAVGARLYANDPTAVMQVLPALTGLATAFGGGSESEAQQMTKAVLAAINRLSDQIEV